VVVVHINFIAAHVVSSQICPQPWFFFKKQADTMTASPSTEKESDKHAREKQQGNKLLRQIILQ
jgi:hypothetical protein